MDFVSWDDDIPNSLESHNPFHGSSQHQPDKIMGPLRVINGYERLLTVNRFTAPTKYGPETPDLN